jgi:hypothetical protein
MSDALNLNENATPESYSHCVLETKSCGGPIEGWDVLSVTGEEPVVLIPLCRKHGLYLLRQRLWSESILSQIDKYVEEQNT